MNPVYCELNKVNNSLLFTDNVSTIKEWDKSWGPLPRELSYRLNSFSTDIPKRWQIRAVTMAFRAWQWKISKLKFRRERDTNKHVDINIEFEDLDHFDGKNGVLAHAYYPGQGEISGDIHINDVWNWVPGVALAKVTSPPLVPILIHEIGHSLGLSHNPADTKDIMYPSFNLGKKKNQIGEISTQRIQTRYGIRTLKAWQIEYWQKRRTRGMDFRG